MRKGEFSKMVITRELYKKFKKEFPEYSELLWIDFYNMWLEIAAKIRYEAIYNPLGTKLGFYCGELKLQYLPYNMKTVDHPASQKLGEEVTHIRLDTREKVPKIKWERRWAVKFNKMLQFYAFDETREIKKIAKEYISNNSHKLRVARFTIGTHSIWRQKMKKQ